MSAFSIASAAAGSFALFSSLNSKYFTKVLPETTKDLFVEAGKITLETANVMSSGTIQVIETGTNIVRDYDPEDLPTTIISIKENKQISIILVHLSFLILYDIKNQKNHNKEKLLL